MRNTIAMVSCALLLACGDDGGSSGDTGVDTTTDTGGAGDTADTGGDDTGTMGDTADTGGDDTGTMGDTADTGGDDTAGDAADTTDTADSGPYDLTFTGTVAPHVGQTLWAAVVDTTDDTVVDTASATVAGDGTFSFEWADILEADASYALHFFADHNGNGACDAPATDHAWSHDIGTPTADVTFDFAHDTSFTDVCDSFPDVDGTYDLTFTGTVAPHANQTLHVAIVDTDASSVVTTDSTTVAGDGTFSFLFEETLQHGTSYAVHFYADHNGNETCDAPPTDHAWSRDLGEVTDDQTLNFAHDTSFTDVCGSFT